MWLRPVLEAGRKRRFITYVPGYCLVLECESRVCGLRALGGTSGLKFLVLLVEVFVELVAVYKRGVRLL